MFTSSLARLAVRKGWKKDESFLFRGELNGCPATFVDGEGFVELILSLPGLTEEGEDWETLQKTIDGYSGLKILHAQVVDGFLAIRIRRGTFSFSVSADTLDLFLTIVLDQAKDLGLVAPHVCAVCHKPAEDLATLFDLACYVHPDCKTESGDLLTSYPLYLRYEDSGKDKYRSLKVKK